MKILQAIADAVAEEQHRDQVRAVKAAGVSLIDLACKKISDTYVPLMSFPRLPMTHGQYHHYMIRAERYQHLHQSGQ